MVRKDIWQTVVGKAKDGQKEMLKAKAKVSNGVGKAKVLTKLTTVTEKPKLLLKLTWRSMDDCGSWQEEKG